MSQFPFTMTELIGSGGSSYSSSGSTATRKFVFDGTVGQINGGDLHKAIKNVEYDCFAEVPFDHCLPAVGDFHPEVTNIKVISWNVTPLDRPYTFEITYEYGSAVGEPDPDDGEEGYQEWSMTIGKQFVDAWRVDTPAAAGSDDPDLSLTPPPVGAATEDMDIIGASIDIMGEPVSAPVMTQEFSVSILYPYSQLQGRLALYRYLANSRNSDVYLGAMAGTLLFPGATVERVGTDLYRVNLQIYWDEWNHCRQVCKRDADGNPSIGSANEDTPALSRANVAEAVYWRQAFPRTLPFGEALGIEPW